MGEPVQLRTRGASACGSAGATAAVGADDEIAVKRQARNHPAWKTKALAPQ